MPRGSLPRVAPSRIGKFGYILTENSDENTRANPFERAVDCRADAARTGSRAAVCGSLSRARGRRTSPTPPPNGPELPELKQLDDSFKPKSLGTDADALQVHALWRQLKNRTVNDPDVQAAKKYAQAARTDLEKRKRLRDYYEVYYQRMSALATTPELKVALQALKDVHQGMLAQPRVRPSPTPEFSGTPSPTPTSTPFKKKAKEKQKKKKVHK